MRDLQVNRAGNSKIGTDPFLNEGTRGDPSKRSESARWQQLLDLDVALHAQRSIRLLTPEARVLLTLRLAGSLPISAAIEAAGISHRGFYAVLDRLRAAGLVATVKDPDDQRVRRLRLDTGAEFEA